MMGKDPEKDIKIFQKSRYFKEIEKQYIDSSKLRSIGWEPKVSLDEGLKRSIAYYTATSKFKD
jgi:nucleoside-diphosphate-sugar epimerase